jgi:hypothetical protein
MTQMLTDFARESDFLSAYLVESSGKVLIQSNGAPRLSEAGMETAKKLTAGSK